MTRVLVTGAAGFIGYHVASFLEEHGCEVTRSDVYIPDSPFDGWRQADLTRPRDMIEATDGIDAVCHIGGIADVYDATARPQVAMEVNAIGTLNLLEACAANRVQRLAYASTWE